MKCADWTRRAFVATMMILAMSAATANAIEIAVPGPWFDTDKPHDVSLDPYEGATWQYKWIVDSDGDTQHSPGEVAYFTPAPGRIARPDNSCWMASAANMVRYRGGDNPYSDWAYFQGITGGFRMPWGGVDPATYTFDEGGNQNYCLESMGLTPTVMAKDSSTFSWSDPLGFITASLRAGNPVGIGVWGGSSIGHALTVYAVDTEAQTLTIADSDRDPGGSDFTPYTYTVSGNSLTLNYPGQTNVEYICAFDDVAWWAVVKGKWSDEMNWANQHLPRSDQPVYLTQSSVGAVTVDCPAVARSLELSHSAVLQITNSGVQVASDVRNGGRIEMNANTSLKAEVEYTGVDASGFMVQQGGTHTVSRYMWLGYENGGTGTYIFYDGSLTLSGPSGDVNLWVGYEGDGHFVQSGGANTINGHLELGHGPHSTGRYELSGSGHLVTYGNQSLGHLGTGIFEQTGGKNTVSGFVFLGFDKGSSGTYEIGGTGELSAEYIIVGEQGSGTFAQTGGTVTVARDINIGHAGKATGTYRQSGGVLTINGGLELGHIGDPETIGTFELSGGTLSTPFEIVGHGGRGDFVQSGGQNLVSQDIHIGSSASAVGSYSLSSGTHIVGRTLSLGEAGGSGTYLLTGNGHLRVLGRTFIGPNGEGHFVQTGGVCQVDDALSIAPAMGSSGEYRLSGTGDLTAQRELIGSNGSGFFVQSGGKNSMRAMRIAEQAGGIGRYEMSGGLLAVAGTFPDWCNLSVGEAGNGTFIQTGGTVAVAEELQLGVQPGSTGLYEQIDGSVHVRDKCVVAGFSAGAEGTYRLHGGQLEAQYEVIGYYGAGVLTHTDGNNRTRAMRVGEQAGSTGRYEISGGLLAVDGTFPDRCNLSVGETGNGTFIQAGGTVDVAEELQIGVQPGSTGLYEQFGGSVRVQNKCVVAGSSADAKGTYRLHGGQLEAQYEVIGYYGTGEFTQTGGINTILGSLAIAEASGSAGQYDLGGSGQLSAQYEAVGLGGVGVLVQTGGVNAVAEGLLIGGEHSANGTYSIGSGGLCAKLMQVGLDGIGLFNIIDPAASIKISERLAVGPRGQIIAVPGSVIHMTGSAFENASQDSQALAGLENLRMIFEGGTGDIDPFEVAGRDLGPTLEGFADNFVLGTLQLGGESGIGRLELVNLLDNQPIWDGAEALYVNDLVVGPGAHLELNGLNVYYQHASIDPSAIVDRGGGSLAAVVPEPASLILLLSGIGYLVGHFMYRRIRTLGRDKSAIRVAAILLPSPRHSRRSQSSACRAEQMCVPQSSSFTAPATQFAMLRKRVLIASLVIAWANVAECGTIVIDHDVIIDATNANPDDDMKIVGGLNPPTTVYVVPGSTLRTITTVDDSILTMSGGETNWIAARDRSRVNLLGGTMRACSGVSTAMISGGTVFSSSVRDSAGMIFAGGIVTNDAQAFGSATLQIRAGDFGWIAAKDSSTLTVAGGTVQYGIAAYDTSTVNVVGGDSYVTLYASGASLVNVYGGNVVLVQRELESVRCGLAG